ncbi:hypothetical protein GOL91_03575 [Sinorhizobium medicae]|nr:hypothetical protein [Sinorhizobium medicae]
MLSLIKANYRTYVNARSKRLEGHTRRVVFFALCSVAASALSEPSSADIYAMMTTGLTILTGFTFTALFSDHSLAEVGLAKPKNETDRQELGRLTKLAENFQVRSRYFITLSIVDVCLLIILSLDLTVPGVFKDFSMRTALLYHVNPRKLLDLFEVISAIVLYTSTSAAMFLFLECLYSFYRLTETIMAIVNARRSYMKASDASGETLL